MSSFAGAASKSWGRVTSQYKGNVVVEGWGTHFNDRSLNAANTMTIKDRRDDGNNVYGKTTFYFWRPNAQGQVTWVQSGVQSTGEWKNATRTVTVKVPLHPEGSQSRAESQACAQMGWPVPDSCSTGALTTWGY
ncbi:MAG: hypothetical protein KA110_06430 [Acidimicrobiia bacterium]|jgi:hypothetical protein|nr:hypothetical protein [Acidimicrobiia bacterium]